MSPMELSARVMQFIALQHQILSIEGLTISTKILCAVGNSPSVYFFCHLCSMLQPRDTSPNAFDLHEKKERGMVCLRFFFVNLKVKSYYVTGMYWCFYSTFLFFIKLSVLSSWNQRRFQNTI